MTDDEFAEAVRTSVAMQLRQNRRHYMGLIDGSVLREGAPYSPTSALAHECERFLSAPVSLDGSG